MTTTPYPFVASTVLTAAQLNSTFNIPVSTKTANYVLTAADAGTRVVMNAAGSTTITVNTSIFSAGDNLEISNIGAGVTTVTAGTATVSSAGPLAVPQYGGGRLVFTSASAAIYYPSAVTVAASSGLTFITSGTFSAVSQGSVLGCFTSTYENYRIILNCTTWGGDNYLIFGVSGTISTASNTDYGITNQSAGSVSGIQSQNANKALITRNYTAGTVQLEIIGPNLADYTKVTSVYGGSNVGTSGINGNGAALVKNNTQFTDFTIRTDAHPSGADSWTYKVYGYQNS